MYLVTKRRVWSSTVARIPHTTILERLTARDLAHRNSFWSAAQQSPEQLALTRESLIMRQQPRMKWDPDVIKLNLIEFEDALLFISTLLHSLFFFYHGWAHLVLKSSLFSQILVHLKCINVCPYCYVNEANSHKSRARIKTLWLVCILCHILKFTGCYMHLISCLGRSDLHGLMRAGSEVAENRSAAYLEVSRVPLAVEIQRLTGMKAICSGMCVVGA